MHTDATEMLVDVIESMLKERDERPVTDAPVTIDKE